MMLLELFFTSSSGSTNHEPYCLPPFLLWPFYAYNKTNHNWHMPYFKVYQVVSVPYLIGSLNNPPQVAPYYLSSFTDKACEQDDLPKVTQWVS